MPRPSVGHQRCAASTRSRRPPQDCPAVLRTCPTALSGGPPRKSSAPYQQAISLCYLDFQGARSPTSSPDS
eukprot:6014572-Alexandrium_andersonii.AAC.1